MSLTRKIATIVLAIMAVVAFVFAVLAGEQERSIETPDTPDEVETPRVEATSPEKELERARFAALATLPRVL